MRLDVTKWVLVAFIGTMRAAAVLFLGATSVFAQRENADWCENQEHVVGTDQQIDACTAIISHGKWPGRSLAFAFFNRANGYSAKGNYDRAIADHSKAIALDAQYVEAYNGRGYAYAVKGDLDGAIADYSAVIQLKPELASAYGNRGAAYVLKGEFDRAIADLDRAIELDPRVAAAYLNRGTAYTYRGDLERAIADLTKAIELEPRSAEAYHSRGAAYAGKGELDRAIADLDRAIELDPRHAAAYGDRGTAYFKKGELDRAIGDFDKAIQLEPELAWAYRNRAWAHLKAGRATKGLPDAEKALKLDPDNPAFLATRGSIFEALGRKQEAIADFKRALTKAPQELRQSLGDALKRFGGGSSSEAQLAVDEKFIHYFYLDPNPKRLIGFLDRLQSSIPNIESYAPLVGFFAIVFKSRPDYAEKIIPSHSEPRTADTVTAALRLSGNKSLMAKMQSRLDQAGSDPQLHARLFDLPNRLQDIRVTTPVHLDILWGASFASGDGIYANMIIDFFARTANRSPSIAADVSDIAQIFLSSEKQIAINMDLLNKLRVKYGDTQAIEILLAATALWAIEANARQHPFIDRARTLYLKEHKGTFAANVLITLSQVK